MSAADSGRWVQQLELPDLADQLRGFSEVDGGELSRFLGRRIADFRGQIQAAHAARSAGKEMPYMVRLKRAVAELRKVMEPRARTPPMCRHRLERAATRLGCEWSVVKRSLHADVRRLELILAIAEDGLPISGESGRPSTGLRDILLAELVAWLGERIEKRGAPAAAALALACDLLDVCDVQVPGIGKSGDNKARREALERGQALIAARSAPRS